ncbi:hypothetical protein BFW01_g11532 [Lasiodiplodia theobromae]|uniref:uncharacterized protein n=1 Tax=Lasiodiplodia theobromae TaxID=45133 RepID=UPI0015C32777|nr:uncharacterized protein LTHEOB_1500 [Lasiodiplodia theobromae]KAF4537309.1 hypothetical protein LTHEOB_1500 [Lasiodiplodia theobromae]KAF9639726.1 hypothetical protein BFW01_g11532 [Lasiodiplodia theobromae]
MLASRSIGLQAARAFQPIRFAAPVSRQARFLNMRATPRMMRPVPKEEHSAHTISQRIRTLKKIPPELIPLGIVLCVAVGAAFFSIFRKLYVDKTLRLSRQRGHEA